MFLRKVDIIYFTNYVGYMNNNCFICAKINLSSLKHLKR